MRAWAFLLSFYLVFGQIYYAHSALPVAVATAKGVGTLVRSGVIMHGAGALARSSYKWCKANKVKCAGFLGGAYDLIMGDDDDRYGVPTQDCDGRWMYGTLQGGIQTSSGSHVAHARRVFYDYAVEKSRNNAPEKPPKDPGFRADGGTYMIDDDDKVYQNVIYDVYDFWGRDSSEILQVYRYCDKSQDKPSDDDLKREREEEQKKREKELWDKLKDKLSDDDITNIVNNYGDDIDIDKYCASGATCYFLDTDFEKEINNNDYDIDKVTNDNCNTRNGKIYSCPNAKKKKDRDDDDDGQTNNDDKKDDDKKDDGQTEKDKDDNGLPIPRLPNFVMPEFCTWAKWFCEDEVKKTDGEINIDNDNLPADSVNINFGGACPASHNFPFRLGGYTFTFTMSYTYICQIAQSMGFIVKVLSTIVATYILLGIKS